MGEATKAPPVSEPTGRVAALVATSKNEQGKFERPKHQRTSSLPSTMPTATASDSDEEGIHSNEETQNSVTTVTTLTGVDTTTECSSSEEDDTDRELSHSSSRQKCDVVAFPSSPRGKGSSSKPSSTTSRRASSLGNSKFHRNEHLWIPPRNKTKPKGVRKAARFAVGQVDSEDEEQRQKNKSKHSTSWSRKSLHRAKIAKEYTTSESEEEVQDAKQLSSSQHLVEHNSSLTNKSMRKAVSDLEKPPGPGRHRVQKDDGNSTTDSEITTNYNSDDDEAGNEHESKRRRIHSRKASIHKSPPPINTWRAKIADEDESITATSFREQYRSDAESHDADHEHQLWEEDQDDETDDDRNIRKLNRKNQGNSASFSGAASRNFRWSNVKTKVYYSFRAKGNDSDDEGSKVISVRNLAPVASECTLEEFFGGCGTLKSVNISRDEFGRCTGSAYVEFNSGAAARKAVQKTGTKLLERVVFCDVAHEAPAPRHAESKAPAGKPAEPPPAGSSGSTGGGIDLHYLLKAFHRADNSEESVRHKKSKSTESLHLPRGVISPGDNTVASGNEQSIYNPDTSESSRRGTAPSTGGASKKKFFTLSKSRSSGSSRNSGKLGGPLSQSEAHSRVPEVGQQSQSPSEPQQIGVQSVSIEVQRGVSNSRGVEFQTPSIAFPSRSLEPHSSPIPEIAFQEGPNVMERLASPKVHKRRTWNFQEWRRKHRWVKKISPWKWVKKPRWHWWDFANLSARWGRASRRPSVKSTTPPPDFEAEPPEEYPEGYPHFSSSSKPSLFPGPVAGA